MLGCPLLHTFLGSAVSDTVTCSDASNKGGAVGSSDELTKEGSDFCISQRKLDEHGALQASEVMALSLFNGIGGAFRCYDVLGVEPGVLVSCEIDSAANRVVSRRWPHAIMLEDVADINESVIRGWLFQFPHIRCIHLWAGFPCVDLSSVKVGRRNLKGSESSLFFHILRIKRLIRAIFGSDFDVIFFVENVASMDYSAVVEISQHLGCRPYRVQCAGAVPISRPRLCWTNIEGIQLPGIQIVDKGY